MTYDCVDILVVTVRKAKNLGATGAGLTAVRRSEAAGRAIRKDSMMDVGAIDSHREVIEVTRTMNTLTTTLCDISNLSATFSNRQGPATCDYTA